MSLSSSSLQFTLELIKSEYRRELVHQQRPHHVNVENLCFDCLTEESYSSNKDKITVPISNLVFIATRIVTAAAGPIQFLLNFTSASNPVQEIGPVLPKMDPRSINSVTHKHMQQTSADSANQEYQYNRHCYPFTSAVSYMYG